MKRNLIAIALILLCSNAFGQASSKTLLINGFLHVGNGETIESALIGIEDGKITLIKNSLAFSYEPAEWDTIIHLNGKHIYPGLIVPIKYQ